MTNFYLDVMVSSKTSWRAKKELKQLGERWFYWTTVEVMQRKGFKYIPTILHTSNFIALKPSEYMYPSIRFKASLPLSYFEEIDRIFNLLRQKISIRIGRHETGGVACAARWSNEILNLKEMRDEINWLSTRALLSKENPEDRKIAEGLLSWLDWLREDEKMTLDEKIDRAMEVENERGRELSNFFLKALEIHTKYPDARFWFHVKIR